MTSQDAPAQATAGHPKGLYVLFGTEMWERFAFYGMKALLIYYMTSALLFSQEEASRIYGWYTAAVYFTPFFGGLLADRFLGQRRAVIIGGLLMATGEFMMMSQALFFPALGFIAVGNGLFKPNISTQVGSLYKDGDPRRDRAFGIFYLGINLGASAAPLVAGTLGEGKDYSLGFMAAGIGLLVALAIYLWGQRHLAPDHTMRRAAGQAPKQHAPLTREEKRRVGAILIVFAINMLYWAAYEQASNTLALWARDLTERRVFAGLASAGSALAAWEMPASWFQSINPLFILVLTPGVTLLWAWQARRGKEPGSVVKMSIGCFLLGIAWLVMVLAAKVHAGGGLASAWWLVAFFGLATTGELFLSPIGLSTVTKVAPPRLVSTLMGLWFLSISIGNNLSGYLGTLWTKMPKTSFFLMLAGMGLFAGAAIFALSRPIKRAMEGPAPALAPSATPEV